MTASPRFKRAGEGSLVLLFLLVFVFFGVKAETRTRYEEHHVALLQEMDPSVQAILNTEVSAGPTAGGAAFLFTRQRYLTCVTKDLLAVFVLPSGRALAGCWHYSGSQIFVIWDDGDLLMYPASDFHEYNNSGSPFPLPSGAAPTAAPSSPPAASAPRKNPMEYPERSQI